MDIAIGITKLDHEDQEEITFDGLIKMEGDTVELFMEEIGITLTMDAAEMMQGIRASILQEKGLL